jgi:hypothetical protein
VDPAGQQLVFFCAPVDGVVIFMDPASLLFQGCQVGITPAPAGMVTCLSLLVFFY